MIVLRQCVVDMLVGRQESQKHPEIATKSRLQGRQLLQWMLIGTEIFARGKSCIQILVSCVLS